MTCRDRPEGISTLTAHLLPTPLYALIQQMGNEEVQFRRVHRLIDAFEWAIKWHTALAVSDLLTQADLSPRMRVLLSAGLRNPSLGIWYQFFREACKEMRNPSLPYGEWERLSRLEERHRIIRFRNTYAHGATPSEEECEADVARYAPVLRDLIDSPLFTEVSLVCVNHEGAHLLRGESRSPIEFRGDVGHAYALLPGGRHVDLWPLGLYVKDRIKNKGWNFYYFNALRQSQVEELNYEWAIIERDRDLWGPFHQRLPLKKWAAEPCPELENFRQEIETLTESFKGRMEERKQIKRFVLQGRGSMMIWGCPGIGKSALIRQTFNEIKTGIGIEEELGVEYPAVFQYLIRNRWGTAQPTVFVAALNSFLDASYDLPGVAAGTTPSELKRSIQARIAIVDRMSNAPRSILFIDGLDENPDLLDLIPAPREWLAVVMASRPVERVADWYRTWERDTAGRTELTLGPLRPVDVRALLYDVADKYQEGFTASYVAEVTRVSEGNPMFLKLLCEDVFRSGGALRPLETIPKNVDDLYKDTVKRVTREGTDNAAVRLLYVLAEAASSLDVETIAHVLEITSIRADAAVDAVRELLYEDPATPDTEDFQLFHESLREWLHTNHPGGCADARRRLARWAAQWASLPDRLPRRYAVAHVVDHLTAARDDLPKEEMVGLLRGVLVPEFVAEKSRLGLDHTLPRDVEGLTLLASHLGELGLCAEWLAAVVRESPSLEVAVHWGVEAAVRASGQDVFGGLTGALKRDTRSEAAAIAIRAAVAHCESARTLEEGTAGFALVLAALRSSRFEVVQTATGALSEILLRDLPGYVPRLPRFPLRQFLVPWRVSAGIKELNGVVEAIFRVLGHRSFDLDGESVDLLVKYAAHTGFAYALVRSPGLVRSLASRVFAAQVERQFKYAIGIEGDSGLFGNDPRGSKEDLLQVVDVIINRRVADTRPLVACMNSPTPLSWMAAMSAGVALAGTDEQAALGLVERAFDESRFTIQGFRGSGDVVPLRSMNLVKMLTHCRPATDRHIMLLRRMVDRWIEESPETAFSNPYETIYIDNEFAPFAPLQIAECRTRLGDDLTPLASVQHYSARFGDDASKLIRLFGDLRKASYYAPQRVLGTLLWAAENLPRHVGMEVRSGLSLAFWFLHSQNPSLAHRFVEDHPSLRHLVMASPGERLSRIVFSSATAESWEYFLTRMLYHSQGFREFLADIIRRVTVTPSVSAGIASVLGHLAGLLKPYREP